MRRVSTAKVFLAAGAVFAFAGKGSWAGDAKKPSALKITRAVVDSGPELSDQVAVPKGFTAELKNVSVKDSDTVHGTKVSFEQVGLQLDISGPGGTKFTLGTTPESLKEGQSGWRSEVEAAKKAAPNEFMRLDWRYSALLKGAGTAGQLFSIFESSSNYSGGMHPNDGASISTWDARTGQQVTLNQLLSPSQMSELLKALSARLKKMDGTRGTDNAEPFGGIDPSNEGPISTFALSTDKSGKVKIEIAWASGYHMLRGTMVHFTVDAPTDAEFRKAIGAE